MPKGKGLVNAKLVWGAGGQGLCQWRAQANGSVRRGGVGVG